jgi:hypothetical protein
MIGCLYLLADFSWDQGGMNNNGFEDPTSTARALRRAGFNLLPIGYGRRANMTQLNALSTCALNASDDDQFQTLIPWIYSRFCL